MTIDINNYVTLQTFRNGRLKISQTVSQEANIYKILFYFGYRKIKLNGKKLYIKREGASFSLSTILDIRQAFFKFLDHEVDFSYIPSGINRVKIMNWFYRNKAIKENSLFDHYLTEILTDNEVLSLSMLTDLDYKHKVEIKQLISKFDELNFSRTVDRINSYSSNNPTLYYKGIGSNKYLVFNHWNCTSKYRDGFDSWIATYAKEKQIGRKQPIELQDIRLGFQLDRDFSLIAQYLVNNRVYDIEDKPRH